MKVIDVSTVKPYFGGKPNTETTVLPTAYKCHREIPSIREIEIPTDFLSKLITLAGRFVDRFASDLLISCDSLREEIMNAWNNEDVEKTISSYWGFRQNGVDHQAFIECKSISEYREEYIQVWRLDATIFPDGCIQWEFYRLSDYVNNHNEKEYK